MKNDFKKFATELIKKVGKIAREEFYQTKNISWKPGKQILTQTDVKLNKLINSEIEKNFPTHSIISEELKPNHKNSDYTWYVDPIDGTIAFAHGIPYFCNAIGLAYQGQMILSVIYDPIHEELFVAQKGKGLFLNDKKIKSTAGEKIKDAYFNIGVWKEAKYNLIDLLHELIDKMWLGFIPPSLMVSGCHSAVGRMDGSLFAGNTTHE